MDSRNELKTLAERVTQLETALMTLIESLEKVWGPYPHKKTMKELFDEFRGAKKENNND